MSRNIHTKKLFAVITSTSFMAISGVLTVAALCATMLAAGTIMIVSGIVCAAVVGVLLYAIYVSARHTTRVENELRRTEKELYNARFAEAQMRALTNHIDDAVASINTHGQVLVYNPALLELMDTHQDISGTLIQHVMNLIGPDDVPIAIEKLFPTNKQTFSTNAFKIAYKNNDFAHVFMSIIPVGGGTNSLLDEGYLIVMRDITKQRSFEQDQKTFISLMSHELRTPLTTTEGAISNLIFQAESKKSKPLYLPPLRASHDQITKLLQIIGDLEAYSQTYETIPDSAKTMVDIVKLFDELRNEFNVPAETKGLKLDLKHKPGIKLVSDKGRIHQILKNLIDNAIKYTENGSVRITCYGDNDSVVFEVIDTGPGIGKSDIAQLFKPFYQSETYETRSLGGTGLGLYLSQRLAKTIGATITVSSELGSGSSFRLTIINVKEQFARLKPKNYTPSTKLAAVHGSPSATFAEGNNLAAKHIEDVPADKKTSNN